MIFEYIVYGVLYLIWLLVVIYNIKAAILLLPLFFPFYLVRFEVVGIPVYFIEGLILIAAIPVFWRILRGEDKDLLEKSFSHKLFYIIKNVFRPKRKCFNEFIRSPFLPIALFLVACFISAAIVPAEYSRQALGILKSWVIIPLIFFVIFYHTVRRVRDVSFALYSYIASASLLSLWALFQAFSGYYITIDQRVSGPFESANYLAMYIAPALVYCSVRFIQTFIHEKYETADVRWNSFERRMYMGGFVGLFFAVLVLSQSYAGIAGVFATLFLYIVYERIRVKENKSRTFLNKIIGFIVLVFVLGGGLSVTLNPEKFQNLTKIDEHTSIGTRIEIWTVGAHLIKESPFLGIGLGQYENIYTQRAEEILQKEPYEKARLHSHNLFMSFWLNSGLLGIISFVWIIVLAYMQLIKSWSKSQKTILLSVLAMFTYILVHGLFDVTFWKNDLALVFWLVLGAVFAVSARIQNKEA